MPHHITRQSIPCPQAFVSSIQLFNLWPCGALNFNIYRIVTDIFWKILQIATFGDPIPRKKGIVGLSSNYPLFLYIWSERKGSNLRLPAPKKSTSFIIITNTYTLFIRSYKFMWLAPITPHTLWRFWRIFWCFWWIVWRIWCTLCVFGVLFMEHQLHHFWR